MPAISAIITTWNRAEMLRRAARSVLNQTFRDFELLILDNNSSDETEEVVKSFADPRIRYIRHGEHAISWTRNLAVRESRGEFLAFLDDDDEWFPDKLELQHRAFQRDAERKVGLVYGAYVHIHEESGKVFEVIYPKRKGNVYEYAIRHRNTLTGSASNPMLRKSAVRKAGGYDEQIKTGEDYELFLRLAREFEFDYVAETVVRIYVHAGYRLSHRLEDYLNTELIVYRKHKEEIARHPPAHLLFLGVIAGKLIRLGRPREAREYLRRAIDIRPLHARTLAQYVLSFLPKGAYQKGHALAVSWYHAKDARERRHPSIDDYEFNR